jgi:type IV fimbrial biogenesis protein FimT
MELMVVLALAGVILAIGAPSFKFMRVNNRLTNAANDHLVIIHTARTEAIKRGKPVAICPTSDPREASAQCVSGDNAAQGFIAFVDASNDCVHDEGEEVLRGEWLPDAAVRVRSSGDCLSFASSGFPQPEFVTGAIPALNIVFCDERGIAAQDGMELSAARGVLVTRTGRALVTRDISSGESAPQDLRHADWPGCP